MFLRDRDSFLVEQAGVGHLDRRSDAVVVGNALLGSEDVEGFCDHGAPADVLGLPLFRFLLQILRDHLGAVDHGQVEVAHKCFLLCAWLSIAAEDGLLVTLKAVEASESSFVPPLASMVWGKGAKEGKGYYFYGLEFKGPSGENLKAIEARVEDKMKGSVFGLGTGISDTSWNTR